MKMGRSQFQNVKMKIVLLKVVLVILDFALDADLFIVVILAALI